MLEEFENQALQKRIEELYTMEMGFSIVVEELMNARRPIIGHNMIYDIGYLYN